MARDLFATILWVLILIVGMLSYLYHWHWMPVARGDMDVALYSRGIGTPLLLWWNGYLGVFLNFQFLSPVGALALPLMVHGVFRWRQLLRWQQALLLFTLLAAAVIGAFGGFNYRYALTLQPVLILGVFAAVWYHTTGVHRWRLIVALALLPLLNMFFSLQHRQRTWHADPTVTTPDTKEGTMAERLDAGPEDLEHFLSSNGVRPTDTVLVNNLPVWYYVTERPGIYFWCGSDQLFLANGKPFLFKDRTDDQVVRYLVDTLHCRYIFSTAEYDIYHPRYNSFLSTNTDQLARDDRDFTLYRVKDTLDR